MSYPRGQVSLDVLHLLAEVGQIFYHKAERLGHVFLAAPVQVCGTHLALAVGAHHAEEAHALVVGRTERLVAHLHYV